MNNAEVLIKFKADDKEAQKTTKNVEKSIEKVGKQSAKSSAVATGVIAGITAVGVQFEKSMANVQAISGATADDMALLEAKAREMGKETVFSASESADALGYMALAGWKTQDMLDGLPGILNLAAAGNTDLATTSDIVTDALTAFGKSAKDSAHLADIMSATMSNSNTNIEMLGQSYKYVASLAGAMNYTMEDTSLALGLMANAGIKADQAGTSLRSMLTRLAKPTDEVEMAMEKLGISLTDKNGKMKSMREVVQNLRSSFNKMTESEKAQYAAIIAGKNAMSGMLALVNGSDEDFDKLANAIDNSSGSAQQMSDVMNQSTANQIKIMWSEIQELGLKMAEVLLPAVRQLVDWGTKLAQWLQNMNPTLRTVILIVLGLIAVLSPLLLIVAKLITAFNIILPIIKGFAMVLMTPVAPIVAVIAIIGALIGMIVYLWNTNENFRNFIIGIWESIKNAFVNAIDSIIAWFTNLHAKIQMKKEDIKNTIRDFVSSIVNWFKELPDKLKDIGKQAIEGLMDGIKGMKDKAVDGVKNVGKSLLNGMKNILGIHSPSKEFAILGKFSVLGYTEALDDMKNEVDTAIQDTFGISPQLQNASSLHYSPNVVVNNDINVSQDPLGQMVSNIKSFSGGAKNDYSFGLGE